MSRGAAGPDPEIGCRHEIASFAATACRPQTIPTQYLGAFSFTRVSNPFTRNSTCCSAWRASGAIPGVWAQGADTLLGGSVCVPCFVSGMACHGPWVVGVGDCQSVRACAMML